MPCGRATSRSAFTYVLALASMVSSGQLLACLMLVPLISCAGRGSRAETSAISIAKLPTGTCPVIPDSTVPDSSARPAPSDSTPRVIIRDGPTQHGYVSILIDGQWATWNNEPLGPDLDPNDVDRVEVLKSVIASRAYGTCPGVGLIIITTKTKKWRPSS